MKAAPHNRLSIVVFGIVVLLLVSCSGSGDDNSLRVRVYSNAVGNDIRVPDAAVVLGDSSGAMVDYGTTDANGEISFSSAPANATITTAMSCTSANYQDYKINTFYDVNVSALYIDVGGCSALTPLGTMTLIVTNPTASFTSDEIIIGNESYYVYGGLTSSQSLTVYERDIQSDGKISVVVLGRDSNSRTTGYGVALDLTFVSGMTVSVAVDQPVGKIQYHLTSIPETAAVIQNGIMMNRKDQAVSLSDQYVTSSLTSTTTDVAYIPDFSNDQGYSSVVWLDRDGDGGVDELLVNGIAGVPGAPSSQSFDFSQMPAIPANPVVSYGTGTARPTFSWSGSGANSVMIGRAYAFNYNGWHFSFFAPPTRTSIVFPELPDSLAAFRPEGITNFFVTNYINSAFSGYGDYLAMMKRYYEGAWSPPSTMTYKESIAYELSPVVALPMQKTMKPSP